MNLKRLKLSAESPLLIEDKERSYPCEDLFKLLPDEILLKILSEMNVRDAARTSLISVRWKNLWKFNPNLNFDPPKYGRDQPTSLVFLEEERKKYSTWVNRMLKSYEGAAVNSLIICFDLDNTYKSNLDTWIDFAVRKSAGVLHVDLLTRIDVDDGLSRNVYTFPKQVLSYSSIKVLRYLGLHFLDVSGPVLENILSMCPDLHVLKVLSSSTLLGLKVCDAPKLEYLEIRWCDNLKYLEISAGNLIKLTYDGPTSIIRLHDAPKLETLSIGGDYCMHKFTLSSELSFCFPHIKKLELDYTSDDWEVSPPPPQEFPEFKVVDHLDITVDTKDEDSLLPFISLIKSCPMLHTLEVEFEWQSGERSSRKMEERQGEELKCLKVVKFRQFDGRTADIELAISILENAPYLEKVIFDPWDSSSEKAGDPTMKSKVVRIWDLILEDKRRAARERARLLVKKYSPDAKLVLL